jgi:beta-lactamase regulating signal transducer with metallopeptidase domain
MSSLLILAALRSAIIAGSALLAVSMIPSYHCRLRRGIALAAMWSLLVLPWLPGIRSAGVLPAVSLPESWMMELGAGLWLLGAVVALSRIAVELWGLARMKGQGDDDGVILSAELSVPCVIGVLRPRIYMPDAALAWSQSSWEAAIRHERQHILQRDSLHRLISAVIKAALWWNPLVHALCRRLEIETELCCDEAALRHTGRRAYGEMLLALALDHAPVAVPSLGRGHGFRERLQRLLYPGAAQLSSLRWWLCIVCLSLGVGAALALCSKAEMALVDEAALRWSADAFPGAEPQL